MNLSVVLFLTVIWIYMIGSQAQVVSLTPTSPSVYEGDALTFTCTIQGNLASINTYRWFRNDTRTGILDINCSELGTAVNNSLYRYACPEPTGYTWTIRQVTRNENNIEWYCRVFTTTAAYNSGTVTVQVKVTTGQDLCGGQQEFTLSTNATTVNERSALTLTCSRNSPFPHVMWYLYKEGGNSEKVASVIDRDGVCTSSIDPSNIYDFTCDTNSYGMTLKEVTRQSNGDRWQCGSNVNNAHICSNTITVQLTIPIYEVLMTEPVGDVVTVEENSNALFRCEVPFGLPAATIRWYKDNKTQSVTTDDIEVSETSSSLETNTDKTTNKTSTLNYVGQPGDNGMRIYCTGSNIATSIQTSARGPLLDVRYPPANDPVVEGISNNDKFNMIQNTNTVQYLTCRISGGNPLPTLMWTCYNGQSTGNTTGQTVYRTITWTGGDQERTCRCTANHYLLSSEKSVFIDVELLYPPSSPIFEIGTDIIAGPGHIVVTEGTNLSVNCVSSDGNPMPHKYTWAFPDGTTTIGQQLEILNIQALGNNLYACTAQNRMIPSVGTHVTGSKSSAVIVFLQFSPRPSLHVPLVTNISVELNTSARLLFIATAYPIPESSDFIWQKCKDTFCENLIDGDVTSISTLGLATNLTIHNILGTSIGRYKLIVSNGIGKEFEQDYFVTLQDRPTIPTQFDYLDVSITTSSVTLVWIPGFNGGLSQTFVIQYKPESDQGQWTSVNVEDESEGIMHFALTNLRSDTEYSARMFAYNAVDQSDVTAEIIFKTNFEDLPETHNSALIGGIVGGCIGATVVVIAAIVAILLIRKRRQGMPKNTTHESDASAYTELNVTRSASTVYDPIQISDTPEQTDDPTEPSNTSTQADPTQYENTQNTHKLGSTDNKEQIQSKIYTNA